MFNMSVKVRQLQITDCPDLVKLMDQLGHAAQLDELNQRFQVLASSVDDFLLVAEDSSKMIVGFLHAKVAHTMHYYPSVEICSLVVNSSSRGQGVGKALMSSAESWSQEKGLPIVWLRSNIIKR